MGRPERFVQRGGNGGWRAVKSDGEAKMSGSGSLGSQRQQALNTIGVDKREERARRSVSRKKMEESRYRVDY